MSVGADGESGGLGTEFFFNRYLSFGASLALSRTPYPGAVVTAGAGPFINVFVSETLLLIGGYEAITSDHGVTGLGTTSHVISLGVAWRL